MYLYRILLLLSISLSIQSSNIETYQPYAAQWADQYIRNADGSLAITRNDLDMIKKLVDSSLRRAQITLLVQQHAWQTIELFWQGWQNFAQTRLNPSKDRPFALDEHRHEKAEQFWQLLEHYDHICSEYTHIAQEIVHGDLLETDLAKKSVAKMRQDVRVFMVHALSDVKKHLEALYSITFKVSPQELVDIFETEQLKSFSLSSFLIDYIPSLAMHKFIHADAFYTGLSQEGFDVLTKIQLIGNQAWDAIEIARAHFYAALLDEISDL
jgi:hypothetical protein